MAEGGSSHIRVEHKRRKCQIPFRSEEQFLKKCKEKFNLGQDNEIIFTLPGDDTEIDLDCIQDFPTGTTLELKQADYNNPPQDVPIITSTMSRLSTEETSREDHPSQNKPGITSTMSHLNTEEKSKEDDVLAEDEFGSDEYFDDIQWFKWDDDQALQDHLSEHGSANIASLLDASLEGWRRHQINIAIIGQSGKGKSSLINALRGITEVDVEGAEVGERETTYECTPYKHPQYDNIIYWDVPGCGTENFPQSTYLKTINYRRYDFFLIVSSERFYTTDIWLAKELMKGEETLKCYFIRSKVDIDMSNLVRRHELQQSKLSKSTIFENFKVEVKTDIMKALGGKVFIQLFLLSSHYPEEYDFRNLQLRLLEDARTEKRLSLAFGTKGLSKPLLDFKKRALRSRQRTVSLLACGARSKISIDFDDCIPKILSELEFYKEQLSLDETGLQSVARTVGITVNVLKEKINLKRDRSRDQIIHSLSEINKRPVSLRTTYATFFLKKYDIHVVQTVSSLLDKTLLTYLEESKKLIEFVKAVLEVE